MNYLSFKSRKLWGGSVSVPSFLVDFAKKTQKKIKIEYEGQYMVVDGLTHYEVTAPPQIAKRTDKYIRAGQPYQLYDYVWNPQEDKGPIGYTKEGLERLHDAYAKIFGKKVKKT